MKRIKLALMLLCLLILAVLSACRQPVQSDGTPKAPHDELTWDQAKQDELFGQYVPTSFPQGFEPVSIEKYTWNLPKEEQFLSIYAKKNKAGSIGITITRKPEQGYLHISDTTSQTIVEQLQDLSSAEDKSAHYGLLLNANDVHILFNFYSLSQDDIVDCVLSIPACKK